MKKKEKNLNIVKDNSKFLITIGTCIILLMVMFYVGVNTSKKTYSLEDGGEFGGTLKIDSEVGEGTEVRIRLRVSNS